MLCPPLQLISKIVHSLPDQTTRPLIVIDTTFLSPFYITPLQVCGDDSYPIADIILTSLSKYSSGHSDIILGSLTLSPQLVRSNPSILVGLRFIQNSFGGVPSPRDCDLMIRSLKTLGVRTLKHGLNALRIADYLQKHPKIEDVKYPGLKESKAFDIIQPLLAKNANKELEFLGWEFPYNKSIKTQELKEGTLKYTISLGIPFGGMIAFTLKGKNEEETERFMVNLRLIALAESLGGVESLIEAPYGMTHAVGPLSPIPSMAIRHVLMM